MKRIGILGGTFDPIHIGHLVAAVNVRHALALDRVLLVVANEPRPKVDTRTVTAARDRLAMVQAAVAGATGLEASLGTERGGLVLPGGYRSRSRAPAPRRRALPDRRGRRGGWHR